MEEISGKIMELWSFQFLNMRTMIIKDELRFRK